MSPSDSEFTVLRQTIAQRGTVRIVLLPVTLVAWAALAAPVLLYGDLPVAALLPLGVLAGGFEAIRALHFGVERVGRYLQVFHESERGPRWETTAMAFGPALPGGGVDPLFAMLFALATMANLTIGFVPEPTATEVVVIAGLHAAFLVRVIWTRQAAGRQRTVELARFQELHAAAAAAPGPPPSD